MTKEDLKKEADALVQEGTNAIASIKSLISRLKAAGMFADARRVLDWATVRPPEGNQPDFVVWVQQQRALCTYKDAERPPVAALREALAILDKIGLFDPTTDDAETLGLGGAIFKRFWEHEGNSTNLQSSLSLYRAGWKRSSNQNRAYCGINAASILDRLAHIARRAALGVSGDDTEARRLHAEAQDLRKAVLASLPIGGVGSAEADGHFWRDATRAEALFGLGDYEGAQGAIEFLMDRKLNPPAGWKLDTFARQLIDIAVCQGVHPDPASTVPEARAAAAALVVLLGDDFEAAIGLVRGRVGLALSGGGFRAAFYHLGVLARLAEVDALRHVEVISTVSGGSIVGTMYYLKLKSLLETRRDKKCTSDVADTTELNCADYVALVEDLQKDFFDGVSHNLRANTLTNLRLNLRMMFSRYSRSHRMGELYEELLFAKVDGRNRRTMDELLIKPYGTADAASFKPNAENWRRQHKVPVLLLNATALNSGHNFQFTANWMGEPPGLVGDEIDMNARYRRAYYSDAPSIALKKFPLGDAVAASSGVPILFAPINIRGLYPDHTVELVDGGVHDNQGIAGLLDEGCNFIICSDASGQMGDESKPGTGMIEVAMRSSEIGQDRVRESEYSDVAARERSGALRGFCFVHLKDGLRKPPISSANQLPETAEVAPPSQTDYGIDRDIQLALAEMRTDLDSFTEVEAHCLMLSGYKAMCHQLDVEDRRHRRKGEPGLWGGFKIGAGPARSWRFLDLAPIACRPKSQNDDQRADLELQLRVGKEMFLKALRLDERARGVSLAFAAVGVLLSIWLLRHYWNMTIYTVELGALVSTIAALILGMLIPATRVLWPNALRRDLLLRFVVPILAWMPFRLHLWLLEPIFQRRGRIDRLLKLPPSTN